MRKTIRWIKVNCVLPFVRYGFTREVNAFSGLGEDAALPSRFGFAPFAARLAETCFRTCAKDSLGCDKRRRRDSSGLNRFINLQNTVPRLNGKRVPICRHSFPQTLSRGIVNHLSPCSVTDSQVPSGGSLSAGR